MSLNILIGGNGTTQVSLPAHMANRHGMIAGATGTGKTVTLQIFAEGFSRLGVPVFMADVKGDLSGLAKGGKNNSKIGARLETMAKSIARSVGSSVGRQIVRGILGSLLGGRR